MRHNVLERWSQKSSAIHSFDPRLKLAALLALLIAVAWTPQPRIAPLAPAAALLVAAAIASRLPLGGLARRAAAVLVFTLPFAILLFATGDRPRAVSLVARALLSAFAVLLVAATTPWPRLLDALRRLGAPRLLTTVIQFLYRYAFVVGDQAHRMRLAAASRGGAGRSGGFAAAAGMTAVLFARSHQRAEGLHRAMLSRGFQGVIPVLETARAGWRDWLLLGLTIAAAAGVMLWR